MMTSSGSIFASAPIAPRLAGKFALITGASRGIGRAVAERFASEGAIVAIDHFRDETAAEEALAAIQSGDDLRGMGIRPHFHVDADVGSEASIEAMLAITLERFGRLDILVNNAGIQSETPGDSFDAETLARIIAVNMTGAAIASRAAIAHFLSRPGGGTIVNTTSAHEIIPKPGYAAYAMAKAGLGHLTRTLALEFADCGIRVNAVGPGATVTDINAAWIHDPQARAMVESHIPMGFAAMPDEIAPVYAFLASDEARYITGQTIFACGGLTLFADFKQNWAS
jgi:glucose 1-dehydrogenase